jgi:hypothetical protein
VQQSGEAVMRAISLAQVRDLLLPGVYQFFEDRKKVDLIVNYVTDEVVLLHGGQSFPIVTGAEITADPEAAYASAVKRFSDLRRGLALANAAAHS